MVVFLFCSYSAYAQAGQVCLVWNANTDPNLGGYQINYGKTSRNYTANVNAGIKTSYSLSGLQNGTTYYFAVKAYDSTQTIWSGFSNEVSKTTPSSGTAPTVGFSANPTSGTAPLTVTFTDSSTGTIGAWYWDFGDGGTSTAKNASKSYTNPGTYNVVHTVSGSAGCNIATMTITATAGAAPVADFTASPTLGTAPLAVTFTNSSTGNITSYSWNFGDGGSSTVQNSSHTYSSTGTFTVDLTVTGPGGTNKQTRTGYVTVASVTGGGSPAGLVAAYNFEEASGASVVDASGKVNHGTLSGATRTTQGKFGNALSFDGVNDWVTVNDSASLDLTTGMTLEAWVYPTVLTSGWRTAIHKEVNRYELMPGSDQGTPAAGGTYTSGNQNVYAPSPLSANTWAHLAVTYDYNSASVRLYINGAQVASKAQTALLTTSTGALRIGGNQAYGEFFQGRIDEIRVYNRALSAAEISTDRTTSVASSSAPVSLIGTNAVGPIADSLPAKEAYAFQNIAAKTGKVTRLSMYVDAGSAATDLVVGLYSNLNGHPYQLLGQGTLTNPTTGQWNNVVLPAISVTSGTPYWIAILSAKTGTLWFRDAAAVTAQLSETSKQTTLTTLPSTWSTGKVYNEGPLSAYGAGYP